MASNYDYTSLEPQPDPEGMDLVNELVAGFVPGLGTAQALRDYKRASKSNDYVGMGLSALGTLPIVGGLAKTAMLLPAIKLGKYDPTDLIKFAESDKARGASFQEIWDRLKLFKYPGQTSPTGQQAKWGMELEPGKLDLTKLTDSPQQLANLFESAPLFDRIPGLAKAEIVRGFYDPKKTAVKGSYAHHQGPQGRIYLSPGTGEQPGTFYHELNHGINAHTGQLGTLGYTGEPIASQQAQWPHVMAELLRRKEPSLGKLADKIENAGLANINNAPWSHSAGERLAEADRMRMTQFGREYRDAVRPTVNLQVPGLRKELGYVPDDISTNLTRALFFADTEPEALTYVLRNLK
jgi:hypothetical protein